MDERPHDWELLHDRLVLSPRELELPMADFECRICGELDCDRNHEEAALSLEQDLKEQVRETVPCVICGQPAPKRGRYARRCEKHRKTADAATEVALHEIEARDPQKLVDAIASVLREDDDWGGDALNAIAELLEQAGHRLVAHYAIVVAVEENDGDQALEMVSKALAAAEVPVKFVGTPWRVQASDEFDTHGLLMQFDRP